MSPSLGFGPGPWRLLLPPCLLLLVLLSSALVCRPAGLGLPRPSQQPDSVRRRGLASRDEVHWQERVRMRKDGECWSRHEQRFFYKHFPMTKDLGAALVEYESMHSRCTEGVNFTAYSETLRGGGDVARPGGCTYVVYRDTEFGGLGNRLLALVSAFAYALLSNRALLVQGGSSPADLLCNPFRNSSWIPGPHLGALVDSMWSVRKNLQDVSMGDVAGLLKGDGRALGLEVSLTFLSKVNVGSFFCGDAQRAVFPGIPAVFLRAEGFLVPMLARVPNFHAQLLQWFPDHRVFLHLGRFLLHPKNRVWLRVTRFFDAYLAHHTKLVGVQVRQFNFEDAHADERVLQCLANVSGALPKSIPEEQFLKTPGAKRPDKIGVFVTSLKQSHQDAVTQFAESNIPAQGDPVGVYRLTHYGQEVHGLAEFEHALEEMILLSMSDVLLTTDLSTFGYIAAGLSGVEPFTMNIISLPWAYNWWDNGRAVCEKIVSEPCFHGLPFPVAQINCSRTAEPNITNEKIIQCDGVKLGFQYRTP